MHGGMKPHCGRKPLDELVVSDNSGASRVRFTQSARRHRIGRTSARYVMATVNPVAVTTTSAPTPGCGSDRTNEDANSKSSA